MPDIIVQQCLITLELVKGEKIRPDLFNSQTHSYGQFVHCCTLVATIKSIFYLTILFARQREKNRREQVGTVSTLSVRENKLAEWKIGLPVPKYVCDLTEIDDIYRTSFMS